MSIINTAKGFFAKDRVNHAGKALMGAGGGCWAGAVMVSGFAGAGFVYPVGFVMVPLLLKGGADLFLLGLFLDVMHEKTKLAHP